MRFRPKFYGRWSLDEFIAWQYDMFLIGLSVSAWRGDYGKATCQNCRCIVSVGPPELTGLKYGKQHREVCGDRNLSESAQGWCREAMSAASAS